MRLARRTGRGRRHPVHPRTSPLLFGKSTGLCSVGIGIGFQLRALAQDLTSPTRNVPAEVLVLVLSPVVLLHQQLVKLGPLPSLVHFLFAITTVFDIFLV